MGLLGGGGGGGLFFGGGLGGNFCRGGGGGLLSPPSLEGAGGGGGGNSSSKDPIMVTSLGSKGLPGTRTFLGTFMGVPGKILMAMGPPPTLPKRWLCSFRLSTSVMWGMFVLTM